MACEKVASVSGWEVGWRGGAWAESPAGRQLEVLGRRSGSLSWTAHAKWVAGLGIPCVGWTKPGSSQLCERREGAVGGDPESSAGTDGWKLMGFSETWKRKGTRLGLPVCCCGEE